MRWSRVLLMLALASTVYAQTAPAIIGRGEAPAALTTAPEVDFRPFVDVGGVYDTGLAGVSIAPDGSIHDDSSAGVEITAGVSGSHNWKRTQLGLNYRGSFYHYTDNSYYDGSEHLLMLGLTRQMTRHTSLTLQNTAGAFNRNFGLLGLPQTVPFDPSTSAIPTSDFFDDRTYHLGTQANWIIQRSTRLSFSLGGGGFLTRRRSSALYESIGGSARGDVQYRLTRRSTIGANYQFSHYHFHKVFGGTDNHGISASYAIQLTRLWEFSGYGGVWRSETQFLQNVPIDPVLAILIGRTVGTIIVHRIDYLPNVSARLSRTFNNGVAHISAGHSVTPGNGVFLTSSTTDLSGGYAYTGLRSWSLNAQGGYGHSRSLGNPVGDYGGASGSISASRQLLRSVHLVASFHVRQYSSPDFNSYNRLIYTARVGLGYSPGDFPLRLW